MFGAGCRRGAWTLLLLSLLAPLATAQKGPLPTPLGEVLPALQNHSSWVQDTRYQGAHPDKRRRGVYPVGNGLVFAYMGLGQRANTMQAITGPQYQTAEVFAPRGNFGEVTFDLLVGGKSIALSEQHLRRVRNANFVVTEDAEPGGLALRTLTFAPPGRRHLTRVLEVANTGKTALAAITLRMTAERPGKADGRVLRQLYLGGERSCVATFAMTGAKATGDGRRLETQIGTLAPGARRRFVCTIATAKGSSMDRPATASVRLADAQAEVRATLAYWRQKLEQTKFLDTDRHKVRDLFADWKVLMLVLRDAHSGAVAPMINHRGAFVFETNGALLAFLRFNLWAEAKDLLRYEFDAARLLGRLEDHVPLDLDMSGLAERTTDWRKLTVPAGATPSWIILQHFWYWRVTQDTKLIAQHMPFLERCLKGQVRTRRDDLLTFSGHEDYLRLLTPLYPKKIGGQPGLIPHDPGRDRPMYSFPNGVLFLIATQAFGEMRDGIDKAAHPERWSEGRPDGSAGEAFTLRSFKLMESLEKRYWLDDAKLFAPALSAIDEEPLRTPVANANLMPLWVGWTYPSGERSEQNLRSTLLQIWSRGTRPGTTPSVGLVTGEVQGMLVHALADRDAKERYAAVDEMLRMAEPAGEWGELYDEHGRPIASEDPDWPDRLRPGASGINLDALMFAIHGSRFVMVPNWDNTDIRLKLRLPRGATFVTLKGLRKDGRELNLYFRETREKLSKEELKENEKLEPAKRRDPTKRYRRIRFHVDQLTEDPSAGYWDVGLNAAKTVFVRYLQKLRPIDEVEFWAEEDNAFFPSGMRVPAQGSRPRPKTKEAELLLLTRRRSGAELLGIRGATIVDTGLPISWTELRGLLLDEKGKPAHARLFLDQGFDTTGRLTFKPRGFWQAPAWREMQKAYRAAGGKVLRPGFATHYQLETEGGWTELEAKDGRLTLRGAHAYPAGGRARLRTTLEAERALEAVLRTGSGCGLEVRLNGKPLYHREGHRIPRPDTDSALVHLRPGKNEIEIRLSGKGRQELFLRASDARGLPVAGVTLR